MQHYEGGLLECHNQRGCSVSLLTAWKQDFIFQF